MPFKKILTTIPEIFIVIPQSFQDNRGSFCEFYKRSTFIELGIENEFIQENFSQSDRGVVRGLHYQKPPFAQGKLVQVLKGEIFDVAVDIRLSSKTFGKWVSARLSRKEQNMLWVPEGFAHGFMALTDSVEVMYKVTSEYSPTHERSILYNDPDLNIAWPGSAPVLSAKDLAAPGFKQSMKDFFQ